jgi:leader peptidase (prepilin peptidase)/N-methyltransferase
MDISFFVPYIAGLFGLIVGSFLNVVILRFGTDQNLGGRSHCPTCKNQLKWYELIPVISFVIQCGKCRNCNKKISPQYILVELGTMIAFFAAGYYSFSFFEISWQYVVTLLSLLVVNAFIVLIITHDIRTNQIPVVWLLGLVIFSFIFLIGYKYLNGNGFTIGQTILFHIQGLLVTVPFLGLWLISRGRWMGFGDVEIIAWIGFTFGIGFGIVSVMTAFYAGAIFAILYIIAQLSRGRSYTDTRKVQIPFAPFLLISWLAVLYTTPSLLPIVNRLFL